MSKRLLVTKLSKSLTRSVLTASASQRRESRFLPKRFPSLRSLEDRLRITRFESSRKSIVDFRESSLLGAAITQNNAILDAAETRDKGRYSAEADYYDAVLDAQEDWTLAQFDALLEEMVNNATAEKAIYGSYAQACAAALNSVGPIYGSGTDLLAYFSVHSNPYAAIVNSYGTSVETAIEDVIDLAHSANATVREEADEASRLAYEVADNAAYASYVTALAQLETAYQTAVSAANAAFNTAAETAESVYTMTVTPALHQYEQDYEYLTSLYSQAVKIIEDGGTVSATYLTDDTISFTVCFVAGTPVLMADGTVKSIEEVRPGDAVLATDHLNPGEAESAGVVRVFDNGLKQVVRLVFDCQTVVCTPEHPFFVSGKGWKTASELENGDQCVSAGGGKIRFERREEIAEPQRVYNFEVGGKHTYYVGATPQDSVLVHNVCASCGGTDCSGPKWLWNPYRKLYTGDAHACDNLMNAALNAAGENLLENAPKALAASEALSFIDPTPLSDLLTSGLLYTMGKDEEAIDVVKGIAKGYVQGGALSVAKKFNGKFAGNAQSMMFGFADEVNDKTPANVSKKTKQKASTVPQNHHPISNPIHRELVKCDKISPQLKARYRDFTTLAKDYESHHGWQEWHRKIDEHMAKYIEKRRGTITDEEFITELIKTYKSTEHERKIVWNNFPMFVSDFSNWLTDIGLGKLARYVK